MHIDLTLNIGDILTVFIGFLAFIGALYIGIQQNSINKKMLILQDAVDVYIESGTRPAVLGQETITAPVILIHNISTSPIALDGYTFNGINRKIPPFRLPPAAQFPNAYYYIYLPIKDFDYVSFTLEFEDSFKRRWKINGFAELKNGKWEISSDIPERISDNRYI